MRRVEHAFQVEAPKHGARLWRNNCGVAVYPDGSRVRYGLAPGSGDLIGFTPIKITPEMVGQTLPVFTSIEAKTGKGRLTKGQRAWLDMLREAGAIACVAREGDSPPAFFADPWGFCDDRTERTD